MIKGMNTRVLLLMIVHAIFFALWFVAQESLFVRGIGKNEVLVLSGIAALFLIGTSLYVYKTLPPISSLKWFIPTIVLNVFLAEFLVQATALYGASLGSNAMAFAPIASVVVGWLLLKEYPRLLGVIGIFITVAGVAILHSDSASQESLMAYVQSVPFTWTLLSLGIALSAGISIVTIKPAIQQTDAFMAPGITLAAAFGLYGFIKSFYDGRTLSFDSAADFPGIAWMVALMAGFYISNWAAAKAYFYSFAASVGALKRLSAPFTVLLAWLVFEKQAHIIPLLIGSMFVFFGALLISLKSPSNPERIKR